MRQFVQCSWKLAKSLKILILRVAKSPAALNIEGCPLCLYLRPKVGLVDGPSGRSAIFAAKYSKWAGDYAEDRMPRDFDRTAHSSGGARLVDFIDAHTQYETGSFLASIRVP